MSKFGNFLCDYGCGHSISDALAMNDLAPDEFVRILRLSANKKLFKASHEMHNAIIEMRASNWKPDW